jgi:hypothetical protein
VTVDRSETRLNGRSHRFVDPSDDRIDVEYRDRSTVGRGLGDDATQQVGTDADVEGWVW